MLTSTDFLTRLRALLPPWFGDKTPVLDGVLSGSARVCEITWGWLNYALLQTRIATATTFNLDLIAWDFFGLRFRRRLSQGDDSFRRSIVAEILRPRATRPGMIQAITDLTGTTPVVCEPWNIGDTGYYGSPSMAYSTSGRYGSLQMPGEVLLDVKRPLGQGIPGVTGFGDDSGGYGTDLMELVSLSMLSGPVTDQDIYDVIEATRPAGVRCWVRLWSAFPPDDLKPSYSYLTDPNDQRLILDDGTGIVLSGPA